jgi:DNA-binding CsgD family transcriptional regulator
MNRLGTINGRVEWLTTRETEVLHLIAEGIASREIAARLGISYATVRSHIRSMVAKLGVNSRSEAVFKARELTLIS